MDIEFEIKEEIEKAIKIAKSNIEIENDMDSVTDPDKAEIELNLINDEEIREKALKKVYDKNDL